VIPRIIGGGAAPGADPVHGGAAAEHCTLVSEREHALPSGGGAGCQAQVLTGAGAGVAVTPPVGDHIAG